MPPDPQDAFRGALGTLRDEIFDAIRTGIPSYVHSGLGVYQRLLEKLLERFNELEAHSDFRPPSPSFLWGDPNGKELAWLATDYSDFLQLAVNSRDSLIVDAVARGLTDVCSTCIRYGDTEACRIFLAQVSRLWIDSQTSLSIQDWLRIRLVLLSFLSTQPPFLTSFRSEGIDELTKARRVTALRLVAKTYGDVMKRSVDANNQEDLDALSRSAAHAFDVDYLRFTRGPRRADSWEPDSLVNSAQEAINAATLGVLGWTLMMWTSRELDNDVLLAVFRITGPVLSSPASALSLIMDSNVAFLFGWTFWEAERRPGSVASIVQINDFVLQAALVALTRSQTQVSPSFGAPIPLSGSPTETVAQSARLLEALGHLEAGGATLPLQIAPSNLASLRRQIDLSKASGERLVLEDIIDRQISSTQVSRFESAAVHAWTETSRMVEVFNVTKSLAGTGSDDWRLFGVFNAVPKDLFFEDELDTPTPNVPQLAVQIVNATLQAESDYIRRTCNLVFQHVAASEETASGAVRTALTKLRSLGHKPQVIVSGPASALELLANRRMKVPEGRQSGYLDEPLHGAQVYWEASAVSTHLIVIDPSAAGEVLWGRWRSDEVSDGEVIVEGGRLLLGVREVTPSLAGEILDGTPAFFGHTVDQRESDLLELQKLVLVRFNESLALHVTNDSAGLVIDLASDESP